MGVKDNSGKKWFETARHGRRGSAALWFILFFVPIVNLYVLYKFAWLLATHEKDIVAE